MSFADTYGGTEPEMVSVEPDANKVCVKTTRYILKKHIHMSPSIEVDTTLTIPTINSNAGKYYNEKCKDKVEMTVKEWIQKFPKDVETQTDIILADTRSEGTQYMKVDTVESLEEDRIPIREDYESLFLSLIKTLLQFHTKFGSNKNNNKQGKEIAVKMLNLATSLFEVECITNEQVDEQLVSTYTGTQTLEVRSQSKTIGPSADLYNLSEENTPKENTSTIMSSDTNIESRAVISLSTSTMSQQQTNECLEYIPDPLGLLPKFIDTPWYDDTYVDKDIEGYEWYLLPPYIHLMLNNSDKIDLLQMSKPNLGIIGNAYRHIKKTPEGKIEFENLLISLIEKDQWRQMKNKARQQPVYKIIQTHESYYSRLLIHHGTIGRLFRSQGGMNGICSLLSG